jgi:hypothetical protein
LDEDNTMEVVDGMPRPSHTEGDISGTAVKKGCIEMVLDVMS